MIWASVRFVCEVRYIFLLDLPVITRQTYSCNNHTWYSLNFRRYEGSKPFHQVLSYKVVRLKGSTVSLKLILVCKLMIDPSLNVTSSLR